MNRRGGDGTRTDARVARDHASVFPRASECLDPRGPYLVPLVLLLIARVAVAIRIPTGAEDAYITYRYAQHFALGGGLTYNPGEHVLGFTSPLWTVWNALGFALTHQPLAWSRGTALVANAVTLLVAGRLLARHASAAAAWCFTFFFAVWPYFPAVSASGLEMPLLLALVPLSAALLAAGAPAGGVALAALALTRPEGLAAAGVLAFGARARERVVALVLVVLGLAGLAASFGTVVPQSLVAKALTYGTPGPWAGRGWWEWLLPFPLGRWPLLPDTVMIVPLAVLLSPAVAMGARALWAERATPLAATAAALLVVWLGYAALGVTYFWWYLALPLAGFALLGAIGLPRIVRGRAVYVSAALLVVGIWSMARFLYEGRAQQDAATFGAVAEYLRTHASPGEKVMLEPIGIIGYAAPVVIVDEVGLVSPRVAQRRRAGSGWYADVAAAERPDWLVVRAEMLRTGEAFAGTGAPFRTAAERDSLFARFRAVAGADAAAAAGALVVLRRVR